MDGAEKCLWLYVTRSNNWPHNIATYYLEAVEQKGECPQKLITDLGTENGLMASIHSFFFFRDDLNSQESANRSVVVLLQKKQNELVDKLFQRLRRPRNI